MNFKKTSVFLAILLPFQILFVSIISGYPHLIEKYYSQGVYPIISKILRTFLGWIPFSFGDVLGLFLLSLVLISVYRLFKNRFKGFKEFLFSFTALLSVLYFCFYFFWGFNYFRKPLAESLQIKQADYSTEELLKTTDKMIERLNHYHLLITNNDSLMVTNPFTTTEIYKLAPDGFNVVAKRYPQLNYKTLSVKNSLLSLMHMYSGTSGYLNPITGEAQVNDRIPKTGFPVTTCHEMAHQIGWSAENEANFVGFLAATSNPNIYFKYAGYRMAFHYLLRDIRKRDKDLVKETWSKVNKGVFKDFKASYDLWNTYENPIEPYIKKGYSSYLKVNNQSKGIKSYSYVVDLLIAYHK